MICVAQMSVVFQSVLVFDRGVVAFVLFLLYSFKSVLAFTQSNACLLPQLGLGGAILPFHVA